VDEYPSPISLSESVFVQPFPSRHSLEQGHFTHKVNNGASIVQHSQLSACNLLDDCGQAAGELAVQYLPRFPMPD
jgi:hypothetical protein